ncbi:MAG: hypothetical protein IJA03_10170 [Bacteroidaceae bacterium]|nr:hypothetical protein [Bacteroidaceae bacterium]
MTKTPTIQTLLLLLLALLTACNDPKPVTDALHRAETLMNEHPDSALAVLNTLSPDAMGKNRTRAHFALLYTQAQDKNYINETNDSLITIATDYYRHTDDVRRKFLSHYYKGRVLANAGNYLDATSCYMEAEQLVDAVADDYLVGLLYAEMGRIYRLYYDYPKSLEAHQKAAECYERAGKIRHRNYMWLNQSSIYLNINKYDESERFLRMALEAGKNEKDNDLIESCLGSLVMSCVEQNQMAEAKELYEELDLIVDEAYGSPSFMGSLAEMYASEGQFVQAEACVEKGWERVDCCTDSINLYVASSELYSRQGRNDLAYHELLKAMTLQNEEAKQALQQPVLTAQCDFLSERLAFEAYQVQIEKRLKGLYVLVSVLALVIVTFLFVWIFKKYRKKSRQVISHLESTKKLIEKEKEEVETEKDRIARALQQLDEDKKSADETISKLKAEISQKEKSNNSEISGLLKKLEEKEQDMTGLQQKLGQDENVIGELKEKLVQKEDSRQKMEALIRQLEEESKANANSIIVLRNDLKHQEEKYQRSMEEADLAQNTLRDEVCRKTTIVSMLFKNWFEVMGMWAFYCEDKTEKGTKKMRKEATLMKEKYMIGNRAFRELEKLVNTYHNDAMLHFRKEVVLLDELDYRRTCYFFAGFPIQTIAWLMDENVKNVYQRRLRLRKMIDSSSFVHKELYILLLSN